MSELTTEQKELNLEIAKLFSLIERYEVDVKLLEQKLQRLLSDYDFQLLNIEEYEIYEAYEKRIPWYKLSPLDDEPLKKAHAVVTVSYNDKKISVGYNTSSNSVSFSVGNGPVKFFNLGKPEDLDERLGKFTILIRRLLKIR